jgi:hypothetical protein
MTIVDSALFHEWKLAALSFIEHVFGLDSVYFNQISKGCEHAYKYDVLRGLGVLKAAKKDVVTAVTNVRIACRW